MTGKGGKKMSRAKKKGKKYRDWERRQDAKESYQEKPFLRLFVSLQGTSSDSGDTSLNGVAGLGAALAFPLGHGTHNPFVCLRKFAPFSQRRGG